MSIPASIMNSVARTIHGNDSLAVTRTGIVPRIQVVSVLLRQPAKMSWISVSRLRTGVLMILFLEETRYCETSWER